MTADCLVMFDVVCVYAGCLCKKKIIIIMIMIKRKSSIKWRQSKLSRGTLESCIHLVYKKEKNIIIIKIKKINLTQVTSANETESGLDG